MPQNTFFETFQSCEKILYSAFLAKEILYERLGTNSLMTINPF